MAPAHDDDLLPEAGDLVWIDFNPIKGSEQAGRRPALVLTTADFHRRSRMAIVCPITSNLSPWPTKVMLPDTSPVKGAVLCEQIRSIDREERGLRRAGTAPDGVLEEVTLILRALILPSPDR
ncbi:MAG: type II toxin-antitoxin system PemK/MazF family toxin [Alphaproteobacteria bacterium]|nr:type II toxin-antitoxin system PemK/MazF family toxin [Alphaproteobacteria bacterium]